MVEQGVGANVYYTVIVPRSVQKVIAKLPPSEGRRILAVLQALTDDPRAHDCRKLQDRPGWRIRVGDYHIIYQIDDAQRRITIRDIRHRRDAYR